MWALGDLSATGTDAGYWIKFCYGRELTIPAVNLYTFKLIPLFIKELQFFAVIAEFTKCELLRARRDHLGRYLWQQ